MTQEELIADLRASIRYALKAVKYKSPRTHDATARDAYLAGVAEAIVEHIGFTWTFEPPDTMRRKAPDKGHAVWHGGAPDKDAPEEE